ncbi:F-box protein SKIP23 [Vitis vinifera]|uniref:F-box protein SKIP23 n=1 Tax=Vitis vinifera TaxID=29760 RepID=A0A438IJ13_VITVI|nr:F-box protein SKIP23 [Vitis vinifera]
MQAQTQSRKLQLNSSMARWSQLPKDLLLLIAQRLNTHFDLLRLRSVCSSWHACVPSRPHPLPSRFPILPTNGTSWGLYLSRRTILCLGLPESHCQPTIGSWLIKVEEDVPDMAHLVNPLSTFQFKHLPPNFPKTFDFSRFRVSELGQEYVLQYMNHRPSGEADEGSLHKGKVAFSSTSNGEDFVMLTIHVSGKLAMFRHGNKRLKTIDDMPSCDDLIFFNGEFYAVDNTGRTVVVAIGSPPVLSLIADSVIGGNKKSLVESNGELLMVNTYFDQGIHGIMNRAVRFKVFKLNQIGHMWVEVENLGDRILFLGEKSTFSAVASEFCGCEGNCIYYTNSFFFPNDQEDDAYTGIGIFNLENGNLGPLSSFPNYSKVIWPPPAWVYINNIGDI